MGSYKRILLHKLQIYLVHCILSISGHNFTNLRTTGAQISGKQFSEVSQSDKSELLVIEIGELDLKISI